ncbi:MAG: ABC transporter permease [Acetatifactor sp.]|nr:ABC transporter permease [Acetatifactor sp.]
MGKMIRFEMDKLLHRKSFYICMIIGALLVVIGAKTAASLAEAEESIAPAVTAWGTAAGAVNTGNLLLLMAIFTAIFVCDDFDQNTLKNIYSKGYSRGTVYAAQFVVSLFAAGIMFAVDVIAGFVAGQQFGKTGAVGQYPRVILLQLIVMAAYHTFFFMMSVIVGKVGTAIALGIVAPMIVTLVLNLITDLLKIKDFSFGKYWLDAHLSTVSEVSSSMGKLTLAVVASLVYAVVFGIAGSVISRRRQL